MKANSKVQSVVTQASKAAEVAGRAAANVASIADKASSIEALTLYSESISTREGGAIKADGLAQQAADKLVQLGYKPTVSETGKPGIPEEIKANVDAAIFAGLLAAGRWTRDQFSLVTLGAEAAKIANRGKERSALTTCIPQYRLRLAEKMLVLCPDIGKQVDEAKAKAKAARAATTAGGTTAGIAEAPAQAAPAEAVSGINPSESREAYMAALNLMIVATGNLAQSDVLLAKCSENFRAVFAEMLKTLQA